MSSLEAENRQLREQLSERDKLVTHLQKYVKKLEDSLIEAESKREDVLFRWSQYTRLKGDEIYDLKQRIADLEAKPQASPAMDVDSYMALRTVLSHTRDHAMGELMTKIGNMQEEVQQFHTTIKKAGFDFEIEHVVNVLNELLASLGHSHRVDADGLLDNGIHTLGDWLSAIVCNSQVHGDGHVAVWENDLTFLNHPDIDVRTMQVG